MLMCIYSNPNVDKAFLYSPQEIQNFSRGQKMLICPNKNILYECVYVCMSTFAPSLIPLTA